MTFDDKINMIYKLIQEKMSSNQGDIVIKLMNGLLDVVEKQYPNEFLNLLKTTGIQSDLDLWTKYSMKFVNQIESLEIDPWKNVVTLELNGEQISSPIYSIKEYLDNIIDISAEEKFLIACYLGKPQNSKIVQIYHNFLK